MALKVAWSVAAVLAFLLAVKWWLEPALVASTNGLFVVGWPK